MVGSTNLSLRTINVNDCKTTVFRALSSGEKQKWTSWKIQLFKCLRMFKHIKYLENVYQENANKNNIDMSVLISDRVEC